MKILLVEDAEDSREMISVLLKGRGHEVIEAEDGESAVQEFENSDCSIVLLDWLLPEMTGIEVANRIKQIRYCYIIMLTALSQREHGEEALNAGAKDYVEKPFSNEELLEAVDLAVAVVTAREKYFRRLEKRSAMSVEMVEMFA